MNKEFNESSYHEKYNKKNIKYFSNVINKQNTELVNKDNLIQSYLTAIDNRNKKKIEILYDKNNIVKDVVYEMYKKNELNFERFQFIIENCLFLNISSSLIKKLMKDITKNYWNYFLKIT